MIDIQLAASVILDDKDLTGGEARIETISEAGFAGIEVGAKWLEGEESTDELRRLCYKHQIAPVSARVTLEGMELRPKGTGELTDIIRRLDGLGAEYLVLALDESGADSPLPPEPERILRLLQTAAQSESAGIRATYEPSPSDLRDDSPMLRLLADQAGGERLGLAPDLGMLIRQGMDPSAFLRRWGARCDYLPMSLTKVDGFDVEGLASVLGEIGFTGWAVIRDFGETDRSRGELNRFRSVLGL